MPIQDELLQPDPTIEDQNSEVDSQDYDDPQYLDPDQDTEPEQEPEPEPEQEQLEDTYNIQVGDKTVSATLEELKRNYSRSQELQSEREAFLKDRDLLHHGANKLASEYTDFSQKYELLNQLHNQISDGKLPIRPKIENYGNGEDPLKQMMDYSKDVEAYNEWQDKFRAITEEKNRRDLMEAQANREREMKSLKDKIPEFADPSKESALRTEMQNTLTDYGFPDEELNHITDHRVAMVVYDALQWKRALAGLEGKKKQVKGKQVRSSAARKSGGSRSKRLLEEYRRTGSDAAAVRYLMADD